MTTVLHLSPHPDDEVLGAGATLLGLRDAGHRIINLACSLGRPDQHERRRAEVTDACERAGFELVIHDPPLGLSLDDDAFAARKLLGATVERLIADEHVELLISPDRDDAHHAHKTVAAVAAFVAAKDREQSRIAGFRVSHRERVVDGRTGYVWEYRSHRGYWQFAAWFPQPVHSVRVECIAKTEVARFERLCAEAMGSLRFRR